MTRLEKGGIRLRLITALAAVTVIAAGVYAAYKTSAPLDVHDVKIAFKQPVTLVGGQDEATLEITFEGTPRSGDFVRIYPKSSLSPDITGWAVSAGSYMYYFVDHSGSYYFDVPLHNGTTPVSSPITITIGTADFTPPPPPPLMTSLDGSVEAKLNNAGSVILPTNNPPSDFNKVEIQHQ